MFLAFFGLAGTITYNALYLQEHQPNGGATAAATSPQAMSRPDRAGTSTGNVAPVSTDLPPLEPGKGESQLVVRAVQRELATLGYDVGPLDGSLSDKTRAAISAFQTSKGIAVTGLPNDDLLRQILLGHTVVSSGATGSLPSPDKIAATAAGPATVLGVQKVLAELGYRPGTIDGAWGARTARAVEAFQCDHDIAETGRITPELLNEVQKVSGRDVTKTAANP
jgi:peptidoglycan hydrolase-like protein with peptidoglycan-binding domain